VTNDRFFADVQVRCFGHSRVMTSTAGPTDLLKDLDDAAQVPALRSQRRVASGGEHRPWASRQLHRLNEVSASSGATAVAAAISVLFLLAALALPHATQWLTAFEALAAAVTLVMVFALQHTQVRQQAAVQRKLDEILRVLPGADQRLLHLETAPQAELDAFDERHEQVRTEALEEAGS
jgi:low affinity Fe/Cu permease